MAAIPPALDDTDIAALQALLDAVPADFEALDLCALDGFLCGVLLQPAAVAPARWLPYVADVDGRALPAGVDAGPLHALVLRRHAELAQAIAARDWFDPWVFQLEDETTPAQTVLPWVAGFAAALDLFPALAELGDAALVEPLALMYRHFEPGDLDDAAAMQALIDTLEPPADTAEAVQDIVRSLMLIADVTQPRTRATPRRRR
jgi:uncharacterized protein